MHVFCTTAAGHAKTAHLHAVLLRSVPASLQVAAGLEEHSVHLAVPWVAWEEHSVHLAVAWAQMTWCCLSTHAAGIAPVRATARKCLQSTAMLHIATACASLPSQLTGVVTLASVSASTAAPVSQDVTPARKWQQVAVVLATLESIYG